MPILDGLAHGMQRWAHIHCLRRALAPGVRIVMTRMLTHEEQHYYALNARVWPFAAPFYDAIVLPLRKVRREVSDMVAVDARSRVLDVATGTGAQARAFAEKAGEVVGIDISESMLRIARRKNHAPNLTFRNADATELPFPDASFDVTCISFALHEMPESIRERALAEMVRVTRPGGSIITVDYGRPPGRWGDTLYHVVKLYEGETYADFVARDRRALLRRAGVEVLDDHSLLLGAVRIVSGVRNGRDCPSA